jgi:outer membrane protein assembly factor BamB
MEASDPATARTDPFEGVWIGKVTAPNTSVEIGFSFQRTDGGLAAAFYMPEMFIYGIGLGPAEVKDGTYTFAPLDATLHLDGDKLVGTFATAKLAVELERGGHFSSAPARVDPPAAPKPKWTRDLGAPVWASPIAHEGTVYVGCTDGSFHAVRASDGTEVWTWKGPHPIYGQALLVEDSLCFVDDATDLVSLAAKDGALRWRAPLHDDDFDEAPPPKNETFNHRTSVPLFSEGEVFVGSTDGGIYVIEHATGKKLWRHDAGARIYAGLAMLGRERLIAACYDGTLVVLDCRTFQEIARTKLAGPIVSAPVVAGDTVVVGSRDYMLYGLKLADLSIAWRDSYWFSWVEPTPRLVDGTLYIGGSDYRRVSALDPATGKARWATDVRGLTWGTPAVSSDTVFAGSSSQRGAIVEHEGGLAAIDRKSGAVKWRAAVPLRTGADRAGYIGSLVLANREVIGAGVDGVLVAYPSH